jgi:hypothetical protein
VAQAVKVDAGVAAQEDVAAVVQVSSEALLVVLQNHDHWFLPLVAKDHSPEIPNLFLEDRNLKSEVLNLYLEDRNLKEKVLNLLGWDCNLKEEVLNQLLEDCNHSLEDLKVILLTVPENATNSYLSEVNLLVELTRFKFVRLCAAGLELPLLITIPLKTSTICLHKCKPSH